VYQPLLLAWLTTVVELVGGFAILIGAFVAFVGLPLAVVLLTALVTVHLRYSSSS
jgi:putative oxidoreductase